MDGEVDNEKPWLLHRPTWCAAWLAWVGQAIHHLERPHVTLFIISCWLATWDEKSNNFYPDNAEQKCFSTTRETMFWALPLEEMLPTAAPTWIFNLLVCNGSPGRCPPCVRTQGHTSTYAHINEITLKHACHEYKRNTFTKFIHLHQPGYECNIWCVRKSKLALASGYQAQRVLNGQHSVWHYWYT